MTDPRARYQCALLLLALLSPLLARADVITSVNAVRAAGCEGRPGGVPPLKESARLDEVAHQLAKGASLRAAQQQAGYQALSSFSVTVSGVPADGDVTQILATHFCHQTINPVFGEIGIWLENGQVWIAYAQAFTPPPVADSGAISARVLELVNAARAQGHRCGPAAYPPVPALSSNAMLEHAGLAHAQDMATFGYLSHTGRDGSAPQERITNSGYRWSEAGENLASGISTPDQVVAGWLQSPEHCANIMDPSFTQMGVAFAVNAHTDAGIYWALEFGRPFGK
jgi:uncharacterized protein YkwD